MNCSPSTNCTTALMMFVLFATQSVEVSELVGNREVKNLADPKLNEMIVSGAAAVAGMMIAAYRRSIIVGGPLVALIIIPTAATIGAGLAAPDESCPRRHRAIRA